MATIEIANTYDPSSGLAHFVEVDCSNRTIGAGTWETLHEIAMMHPHRFRWRVSASLSGVEIAALLERIAPHACALVESYTRALDSGRTGPIGTYALDDAGKAAAREIGIACVGTL